MLLVLLKAAVLLGKKGSFSLFNAIDQPAISGILKTLLWHSPFACLIETKYELSLVFQLLVGILTYRVVNRVGRQDMEQSLLSRKGGKKGDNQYATEWGLHSLGIL